MTVKRAPDILTERCTNILGAEGELKPLNEVTLAEVRHVKEQWSAEGKRAILLARKILARGSILADSISAEFESQMLREAKTELTLVGLVGIIDPTRPEIPEVMRILRHAHISLVACPLSNSMVTPC